MTDESPRLIQELFAQQFDYLPKVESPEQRKGPRGIVNLFALASHMLAAMSGTLAIVSVDRFGANRARGDAGLYDQVHRLVDLSVQTSSSLTRLIGMAMSALQSEQISSASVAERESIQQVMATGYIYIDALNAVSLETTNMARWRGVWGRDAGRAHRPAQSPQPNDPEGDKARQSVRMLVAQVMELGLRAELYDGTWSMS
ncbi:hypothetical protein [Acidovorax sp.]|uniref:hypothetical protein n=1 Tax=Acidovorax sp. TaxID=1872122 RepID=UPI0025BCAFA1|nr:hypothetical protein [Acidovorax sp.]MBL7090688.1 hypothetical protein [Acidovorax sp.]